MFEDKVAMAIRLLDQVTPEWRDLVDWDVLDMQDISLCVLGQVYGGYNAGINRLQLFDKADLYGFDLAETQYYSETPPSTYFWELQAEWKRQATEV